VKDYQHPPSEMNKSLEGSNQSSTHNLRVAKPQPQAIKVELLIKTNQGHPIHYLKPLKEECML